MMLVILERPIEYYLPMVLKQNDDVVTISCMNEIDLTSRVGLLVSILVKFGYEIESTQKVNEIMTEKNNVLKNVVVYNLKKSEALKEIQKSIEHDKIIKLMSQMTYKGCGKMIHLNQKILGMLKEKSIEPKEDYNKVIERLFDEIGILRRDIQLLKDGKA